MRYRQQSAIEFISVYGLVLLIIAIALSMLVFIAAIPRTILPTQCAYYNTFTCPDAVLSTNSTGSTLLVDSVDSTPGIVNISSFSAFIGSGNSRSGYCVPSQAQQGQTIYCIANFNSSFSTGTAYTGTFSIHANYCAGQPSTLLSTSCPAGSNYSFAGSIRIQPSHAIIGGINTSLSSGASGRYVPITITNSQSGAAPAHFQQMITFDPQTYAQYERPDLGNLRFYYGSKELYSWCESGCSSSSASAVFWVRMPVAIPSQGSRVIDMYFLPFSVQYDGIYAGEAPQLTTPYAEYDNGASVFNNYWNFAGTSLPSGWQGSGYTVNNGLTIGSASGDYAATTSSTYGLNPNQILDFYGAYPNNENSDNAWFGYTTLDGITNYVTWVVNDWSGLCGSSTPLVPYSQIGGTGQTPFLCSGALSVPQTGVFSVYWASSSSGEYYFNYTSKGSYSSYPSSQLSIGGFNNAGQEAIGPFYWARVRAYPPNGIMPSATFGSVA